MEPPELRNAPRRCQKCYAPEPDASLSNCRSCGGLLAEALRSMQCPKCGPRREDAEVCGACGTKLVIGEPLEECYPEKPFPEGLRPVILLADRRTTPELSLAAGAPACAEESDHGEPRIKALNLTTDVKQMEGVPKNHVHLGLGETVTVYARGQDEHGKWCPLPDGLVLKWRHDRDLKITEGPGQTAAVTLVGTPKVSAVATARTTVGKKKLQRTFTVEKNDNP